MRQTKCVDCGQMDVSNFANPDDLRCLGCEKEWDNFQADMEARGCPEYQFNLSLEGRNT